MTVYYSLERQTIVSRSDVGLQTSSSDVLKLGSTFELEVFLSLRDCLTQTESFRAIRLERQYGVTVLPAIAGQYPEIQWKLDFALLSTEGKEIVLIEAKGDWATRKKSMKEISQLRFRLHCLALSQPRIFSRIIFVCEQDGSELSKRLRVPVISLKKLPNYLRERLKNEPVVKG